MCMRSGWEAWEAWERKENVFLHALRPCACAEALKKTRKEVSLALGYQLQPLAAKAVLQSRSQRMFGHSLPGDHGLEHAFLPNEEEARVVL